MPACILIGKTDTLGAEYRLYEVCHIYAADTREMADYDRRMALQEKYAQTGQEYASYPETAAGRRLYERFLKQRREHLAVNKQIVALSADHHPPDRRHGQQ